MVYIKIVDAQGRVTRRLRLFGRDVIDLDPNIHGLIYGFNLDIHTLTLYRGVDWEAPLDELLETMTTYPLLQRITGDSDSEEEYIQESEVTVTRDGEVYVIREYWRYTFYKNFRKVFGRGNNVRRVWGVTGPGCANYTFTQPQWLLREPSVHEVIDGAKEITALGEGLGEDHE